MTSFKIEVTFVCTWAQTPSFTAHCCPTILDGLSPTHVLFLPGLPKIASRYREPANPRHCHQHPHLSLCVSGRHRAASPHLSCRHPPPSSVISGLCSLATQVGLWTGRRGRLRGGRRGRCHLVERESAVKWTLIRESGGP